MGFTLGVIVGAGGVVTLGVLTLRRWAKELGERVEAQDQSHLATHEIVGFHAGWAIRALDPPNEIVAEGVETEGQAMIECLRRNLRCKP